MALKIVHPVVKKTELGGVDRLQVDHPAFGSIRAGRVTGKTYLHGSDFSHHSYIEITISEASLVRDLSTDWHHPGKKLVSVMLSEAQWATFISSLNVSAGSPCTLQRVGDTIYPGLGKPQSRQDQFKEELRSNMEGAQAALDKLAAAIAETKLSKTAIDSLLRHVRHAAQEIGTNSEFVSKCFSEHMEETVEKARTELSAYAQMGLTQAGMKALTAGPSAPAFTLSSEEPRLLGEEAPSDAGPDEGGPFPPSN